jgi:integrase
MKQLIKVIGNIDYHCVQHQHGEQFIQACLDSGNRAATANKKIGTLKRMFQLAVQRRQLDENPFRYVRRPRVPRRPVSIFSEDDCTRILRASRDSNIGGEFEWGLFIFTALCTAMRRGELLNTTWTDIDFERQVICVSPKEDSKHIWQWDIKDTDRRVLPLTNELIQLLAEHQAKQPEGYPYVFIPPARYDHIQKVRMAGKWHARQRACPVGNFRRQFTLILRHAGIKHGQFHDFRRTCLTNWFTSGLSEFDVMNAAGHASFETTRRFYLAVRGDLLDRVRTASTHALQGISVANLLQVPSEAPEKKGCQTQPLDSQGLTN